MAVACNCSSSCMESSYFKSLSPGTAFSPKNCFFFYGERFFAHAAPKCWNFLPENIKSVNKLDSPT